MRLVFLAAIFAAMLATALADDGMGRCQERFSHDTCFAALKR